MTRATRAALALLGALALSVGFAGTATAQQVPTCAQATTAVTELEADLASAQAALVTAEGVLATETAELDALPAPDEDALASAQASFDAADAGFEAELPELLEFSPDDYPGGVVPTLDQLRSRDFLEGLLPADPDTDSNLGTGAQIEVNQAIAAFDTRTDALANLEFTEAAVEAAQAAINAQELVVLAAQGDVTDARALVAEVDEDLADAREVRAEVCPTPTPTPTGTATPTPTATATVVPTPTSTTTVIPAQPAARSGTLPRTGSNDLIPIGAAGFLALLTGAGLAWKFRTRLGITGGAGGTTQ